MRKFLKYLIKLISKLITSFGFKPDMTSHLYRMRLYFLDTLIESLYQRKRNEKGELEPYFKGDTFDDKLNYLYDLEEDEDPLLDLVYDKLTAFVSFWYFSVSATKEDFENLEKDIEEGTL